MRVSLAVTNYSWPGGAAGLRAEVARVAEVAEEVGVHTVWLADHLIQAEPGRDIDEQMLEAYTTLGISPPAPNASSSAAW